MRNNHCYENLILMFLCSLLLGCGYTQLIRHQVKSPIGNVIDIFPSEYEVEILDSSQIEDDYIVIDSFYVRGDEQTAIREAWKRDADAILDIRYYNKQDFINQDYIIHPCNPQGHYFDRITILGKFIKYIKYIFPCDSPAVTFKLPELSWIVATVIKYNDSVVLRINDEKLDRIELITNHLDPGIYEIHVVVGENPIWTRRGRYWETSRWIEVQ